MRALHAEGAKNLQAAAADNAELRRQNAQLAEQAKKPKTAAEKIAAGFKLPEGQEQLLHVLETMVSGEELSTPRVRSYDPTQYETMITKQAGYQATVLHDPRKVK